METGIYRHYKGGLYQLAFIGAHTETDEYMVVYIALTGAHLPGPRVRIRTMFGDKGWCTPEIVDGQAVPRFTYIGQVVPQEELSGNQEGR